MNYELCDSLVHIIVSAELNQLDTLPVLIGDTMECVVHVGMGEGSLLFFSPTL